MAFSLHYILIVILGLSIKYSTSQKILYTKENIYESEETVYDVARDFTKAVYSIKEHIELFHNWYGMFLNKTEVNLFSIT